MDCQAECFLCPESWEPTRRKREHCFVLFLLEGLLLFTRDGAVTLSVLSCKDTISKELFSNLKTTSLSLSVCRQSCQRLHPCLQTQSRLAMCNGLCTSSSESPPVNVPSNLLTKNKRKQNTTQHLGSGEEPSALAEHLVTESRMGKKCTQPRENGEYYHSQAQLGKVETCSTRPRL